MLEVLRICSVSLPVGLWELEARACPHQHVQEIQGLAKLLDAVFQDQKCYIWTVSTMQGTKRTKELERPGRTDKPVGTRPLLKDFSTTWPF